MREIEAFILVILMMMGLPDLLGRLRRSALLYPAYLLAGVVAGPLLTPDASRLLHEIGKFGFILMLFGIGLEIDLPGGAQLRRGAAAAVRWLAPQYVVLFTAAMVLAMYVGRLPPDTAWRGATVASLALAGCSISIAFPAWLAFRGLKPAQKADLLYMMVCVEVATILLLSPARFLLGRGALADLLLQLAGMAASVALVWWGAGRLPGRMFGIFQRMTQWKVHFIVLFVFAFAAIGGRLGLSPAKAAFFLGLGMSRVTREGWAIDHHLRPLGQRLLIPVFLVSLGSHLPLRADALPALGAALATAVLLMAMRDSLYRRWVAPAAGAPSAHWLAGPNLTMVAIAVSLSQEAGGNALLTEWAAFTGLFVTVGSMLMLPPDPHGPGAAAPPPSAAAIAAGPPESPAA